MVYAIQNLGGLPDVTTGDVGAAFAISNDGLVIGGRVFDVDGKSQAFRWTAGGGIVELANDGVFPYILAIVLGLSSDGDIASGDALNTDDRDAGALWDGSNALTQIGFLPFPPLDSSKSDARSSNPSMFSSLRGISGDGLIAAGYSSKTYAVIFDSVMVGNFGTAGLSSQGGLVAARTLGSDLPASFSKFLISFFHAGDGMSLHSQNDDLGINITYYDSTLVVSLANASAIMSATFTAPGTIDRSTLRHVIIACDTTANVFKVKVNRFAMASSDISWSSTNAIQNPATGTDPTRLILTRKFGVSDCYIGDFWMEAGETFRDIDDNAVLNAFIDTDLVAVDVGSDGSIPFGASPQIYLHATSNASPEDFVLNNGSGGPWSNVGADEAYSTLTPPDKLILVVIAGDLLAAYTHSHAIKYAASVMTDLDILDSATFGQRVTFQEYQFGSTGTGISLDGSTIVGYGDKGGTAHALKYQSGTLTDLGLRDGGSYSLAYGASGDGSIIVGAADNEAFRYTDLDGYVPLGFLPDGTYSSATAISSDGSVIVGSGNDIDFNSHAVMWVNDVIYDLGFLPGGNISAAFAVSSDGSVIAGTSNDADGNQWPVRWYIPSTPSSSTCLVMAVCL